MATKKDLPEKIPALRVTQWLSGWDEVGFNKKEHRRKPEPHFYLFTLSAAKLKALAGISRRTTKELLQRDQDLGIQRRHDESRSKEIREFVRFGFPWSDLTPQKRKSSDFDDLRKPGWLPTSIVVNILQAEDERKGEKVDKADLIEIQHGSNGLSYIVLPEKFTGANWKPKIQHPIEVIDGQHRLWAFEDELAEGDFELPVVAFYGLDISWQAYLFYTINIKPKKINASLAYDLYPLLRTETWLDRFSGHAVYRETRAQELTSALWGYPQSPWYKKINMLGEPGFQTVTQSAWIRSLMSSYIKSWEGRKGVPGGLFGSPVGRHDIVLPWSGAQQAAFLIFVWQSIENSIKENSYPWIQKLRAEKLFDEEGDLAFLGPHSLLRTDQGVRGILYITNDFCYKYADKLKLENWNLDKSGGAVEYQAITEALKTLKKQPAAEFIRQLADELASFDWRTSAEISLTDEERQEKLVYRGSGGYKELRRRVLVHIRKNSKKLSGPSREILKSLGF